MKVKLFPAALLLTVSSPLLAYNTSDHKELAADAAAAVCTAGAAPFCAELDQYLPFLLYGTVMEDEAVKGNREIFNGVEFRDEEAQYYGPCSEYMLAGKKHTYCNHYFFIDSFLAGGPEGACGSNILDATNPDCGGPGAFRWESARQRGLRLWREKVMPYYNSDAPDAKARAYYWLGRVAHLLADVSVPAHDIPHLIDYVELEHRVFEHEAGQVRTGPLPALELPADLSGLFTGLATRSLKIHDEVRAGECRRDPRVEGCDQLRASPSKPLETDGMMHNLLLLGAIMKAKPEALAKPEILAERKLASAQLAQIKPLAVAHTARLLQLFGAQTGLSALQINLPAETGASPSFEGRTINFDGTNGGTLLSF